MTLDDLNRCSPADFVAALGGWHDRVVRGRAALVLACLVSQGVLACGDDGGGGQVVAGDPVTRVGSVRFSLPTAHRVVVEGRPRIEVTVEAEDEGGNRAAGGNATAAARLVDAIPFLVAAEPGLYDALQVPLRYGTGRLRT